MRTDSDALAHQHGVDIASARVVDVQLLNTLVTRARPVPHNRPAPFRTGIDNALALVREHAAHASDTGGSLDAVVGGKAVAWCVCYECVRVRGEAPG